jgi:hypothetical protein
LHCLSSVRYLGLLDYMFLASSIALTTKTRELLYFLTQLQPLSLISTHVASDAVLILMMRCFCESCALSEKMHAIVVTIIHLLLAGRQLIVHVLAELLALLKEGRRTPTN